MSQYTWCIVTERLVGWGIVLQDNRLYCDSSKGLAREGLYCNTQQCIVTRGWLEVLGHNTLSVL